MNTRLTRLLSALLAPVMLLSLAACGKEDSMPGNPENSEFVPVSMTTMLVTDQEIDQNGLLIMDQGLDSVEFIGGGPGAAAAMTRAYNEVFIQTAQRAIAEEIPIAMEMIYQLPENSGHSTYFQTAYVQRSDETVFTVRVETNTYSVGAAHGNVINNTLSFDPIDGKTLSLKDLGVDGADPTEQIAYLLAEKYLSDYKDEYMGYLDGLADAVDQFGLLLSEDIRQWYISDEFVIICNPYDVAPYAAGLFEISLSPAELEGIVDAKWFAQPAPEPQTMICADENDIRQFDMVHVVGDYGYEMNLVWFDRDVTNAYLAEVEYTEDGGIIGTTTLDAFAELKKGEALLLDIMIPEGFPNTALAADIDGRTYTWLLGYNGRDGGISFVEAQLQPAG